MPEFDLVVAGEINPDLIMDGSELTVKFDQVETLIDDLDLVIGSSSVIFACGAASLGLRVAFVGVVGKDHFGEFMLKKMEQKGLDISHVIIDPNVKTGISVILNRQTDRAILTYLGAMDHLHAQQIPDSLLLKSRHLHVASYYLQTALQPGLVDLFRRAKGFGLSTSLDTNWDPSEKWDGLSDLLDWTDIFLPNENELCSITGKENLVQAVQSLRQKVPYLAVKRGGEGAVAIHKNQALSCPALPIHVIDTVGAGDTFDAGFVYGYLQDWPLDKMLELAIVCGSLSTRQRGGTSAQPGLHEAVAAVEARKVNQWEI